MMTLSPKLSARTVRNLVFAGFAVLMLGLLLWSFSSRRSANGLPSPGRTNVADATLVAEGKLVYAGRCASCHGANLEGQPNWETPLPDGTMPAPPHDASGHTWHHNDQSLFTTVKFGGVATAPPNTKNAMPALGGVMSDREIWAVLSYIKSTWPPELQQVQEQGHQ